MDQIFQGFNFEALLLFLLGLFAILLLLVVLSVVRNTTYLQKLASPREQAIQKAHKDAQAIVNKALQDAHEIVSRAEEQGTRKILAEKLEARKIEENFQKALGETVQDISVMAEEYRNELQKKFAETAKRAEEELKEELPGLRKNFEDSEARIQNTLHSLESTLQGTEASYKQFVESLRQVIDDQFSRHRDILRESAEKLPHIFSEEMKKLEEENRVLVIGRLDEEFAHIKKFITVYRDNHLAFLDETILALVEDTVAETLEKKLSLEEHVDLVYRSLNEAKQKNIL